MSIQIEVPYADITAFCEKWKISEFAFFGRKVDMITRKGIERSKNYIRRKAILESAQVIHAA